MTPALTRSDLIDSFNAGFRPRHERLVGLEYELLGVDAETGAAIPYRGGERAVTHVLSLLRARHGWNAVGGEPLLELERDGSRITLEPGAQIELSARPYARLAEAGAELTRFVGELRDVSSPLGVRWLPLGVQPRTGPQQIEIIPKERYRIMTRYLPTRGAHALWMMRATAGMQVNLDVGSPREAARKLRLAMRLCPLLTALFANSPVTDGRPNGFLTRRAWFWRDVDPDRCGVPPALIVAGATTADYVDWAIDAGMFFIERDRSLIDMTGHTFREYLERGVAGHRATLADWNLHLTTLFPEARLKSYLEIRCADSNRIELALALAALCVGLFYGGEGTLAEAEELVGGWSHAELTAFHERSTRLGLRATAPDGSGADVLVRRVLLLAAASLERARPEDRPLLAPAEALAAAGRSPADDVLANWSGAWGASLPALAHAVGGGDEIAPAR